jgi:hypothetical protein
MPVPAARRAADNVTGVNHVNAVVVSDDAAALDEHYVLAAVVDVRHGARAGSEADRHGLEHW